MTGATGTPTATRSRSGYAMSLLTAEANSPLSANPAIKRAYKNYGVVCGPDFERQCDAHPGSRRRCRKGCPADPGFPGSQSLGSAAFDRRHYLPSHDMATRQIGSPPWHCAGHSDRAGRDPGSEHEKDHDRRHIRATDRRTRRVFVVVLFTHMPTAEERRAPRPP